MFSEVHLISLSLCSLKYSLCLIGLNKFYPRLDSQVVK